MNESDLVSWNRKISFVTNQSFQNSVCFVFPAGCSISGVKSTISSKALEPNYMDTRFYNSHLKQHGVLKTLFRVLNRSVNRLFTLKIFYCVKIDLKALNRKLLPDTDEFQITRLKPAEFLENGNLDEYQMNERF